MGEKGYVDLHTHTQASDGTEAPASNVRIAREAGLFALAITDHDTVAGLEEAQQEGARLGIEVVPGVEISTAVDGKDIHVLGYYFDKEDPVFLERLHKLRSVRDQRNMMILEKLDQLGIPVSMEEVMEQRRRSDRPDDTVGRPHIAEVLIRKGYVGSLKEAFDKYLGSTGAAYVNPPRIRPEEAIQWIHDAGGAAVLAHPGLYQLDELIETLAAAGLDGLEVDHADHTQEDVERYRKLAEKYNFIQTAGSDFHGERNGVVFHAPLGSRSAPAAVLEELKAQAVKYQLK